MIIGMKCFGCQNEIEIGGRYIEDTASGFIDKDATPEIDGIIADIFGGKDGKVVLCDDCTVPGDKYMMETFYGDECDDA
jgi:hypothetical protein